MHLKLMNLLLLSSSKVDNTDYLEHAASYIQQHLGLIKEVLFIPYAGISIGFDDYETKVAEAFLTLGYTIRSIHNTKNPKQAIEQAKAIAVGGGNTFCLLDSLYQNDLIDSLKAKIKDGTPYIGWSAGSNIAAPSIKTTNDMPIIEPLKFDALNLLPFQINPHYIDGNPVGHHGETREMRINEFLTINPEQTVVGLPEGTALRLNDSGLQFLGQKNGFIFNSKERKKLIEPDANLNHLLG